MNVLHIGKFFSPFKGGVETYLADVMPALCGEGVRCAALVHHHQRSLRSSRERFETDAGPILIVRAGTWTRAFFTPISPAFRSVLKRLLASFKPDVVHVHLPNPSACWLLTLRAARRIPLVVHWHSDVVTRDLGFMMRFLYRLYRPLERQLLKRAAAIIATSESYLETSESLSEFPEKSRVIPLGLATDRLPKGKPGVPGEGLPGRDLQVLSVGRLTYYKGFGYLIRAMAGLSGVQLHIVGDGELRSELETLAEKMQLHKAVIFHGALSDDQLADRFMACDCVCLASIERTEAFGLVLLESMYFGRATVASRVHGSGMAWVVQDGTTGITVPPRNATALAAAFKQLRDDPALLESMGRAGEHRFHEQFTIAKSASALARTYQTVMQASGSY